MSRLRRICNLIAAVLLAGCAAAPAGAAAPPLGSSRDVMVAVRTRDNYGAQVVETALGSLAADALRECAGADIAIVSGGHFAWNLDGGPVTEADVRSILPDGHETAVLEVTAAQLRHILELAVSRTAIGEDECIDPDASAFAAFPQIAGFSFTYDASQRPGGRVRDIRLDGGDAPLDEPYDAVARGKPDLVAAAGGEAIGLQRVVDGQVEVLQRVQKGSVKVKDNGLVHG